MATSAREVKVQVAVNSELMKEDPQRALAFIMIKTEVIELFSSLSFGEEQARQVCWEIVCKDNFPVAGIHRNAVKHKIVELYDATARAFKAELQHELQGSQDIHLNLDLWIDKFSSIRCIGK